MANNQTRKLTAAPKPRVQQAWELEHMEGGFRIPPPPAGIVPKRKVRS